MTYHDRLWADAPEGATHYGRGHVWSNHGSPRTSGLVEVERWLTQFEGANLGALYSVHGENGLAWKLSDVIDLHPRPVAYQSAAQLIEAYRKEHGAEIEEWVGQLKIEPPVEWWVGEAARMVAIADALLAAERKRIEESGT